MAGSHAATTGPNADFGDSDSEEEDERCQAAGVTLRENWGRYLDNP